MGRGRRTPVRVATGLLLGGAVIAGSAAGVLAARYDVHRVSGAGMAPTLRPGDAFFTGPAPAATLGHGDVLLLDVPPVGPGAPGGLTVKRLVGTGGDRIASYGQDGRDLLRRNGVAVDEPYASGRGADFETEVRPHRLFVLGDNRSDSVDSRMPTDFGNSDGTLADTTVRGRVVWASGGTVDAPGGGTVTTLLALIAAGTVLAALGLLGLPVVLVAARRSARRAASAAVPTDVPADVPAVGDDADEAAREAHRA